MYREENGELRDGVMIGPKVLTPALGKKPAVHCPLIVTFCPWLHGMTEHQFTKIKDKWKEAQEYKTGAPHSEFNSQMACVKPAAAFIKEVLMDAHGAPRPIAHHHHHNHFALLTAYTAHS